MLQSLISNCNTISAPYRSVQKKYMPFNERLVLFKAPKAHRVCAKAVAGFSRVVLTDSLLLLEGHESPALNLASKPPGLALTL